MCGVAGELRFADALPARAQANWAHLGALMQRRGPDAAGAWDSSDGLCHFEFRRLAIIDLSPAGHQPMLTADGRCAIVFNGEIYNYRELRADLERSGVSFRSHSDTEVALQALATWGHAALERFNGIFAIAFYDCVARRLLLARDHAGIKPLYVLQGDAGVAFASQYDQILAHPWARELPLSQDALALYLRLAFIPAPYAALERTSMLEPGSWLEVEANGKCRGGAWYRFPRTLEPDLAGDEALEATESAIASAVRRQLVSDVPVGAFLSGGVDSPLVVAKMRSSCSRHTRAFTIGTEDPKSDETDDATAYARELGVDHVVERVTEQQALDLVEDAIAACGEPFGDYSVIPTMLVSRLAAREYKVVLSGDGGDELFFGYVRRMANLLQSAPAFLVAHPTRRAQWWMQRLTGRPDHQRPLLWPTLGHMQAAKHTHLPITSLERIFPRLPAWPGAFHTFDFDGSDADDAAQWLRWNEFVCHLTMVLLKVDRASMFHSLEVRVPLLDREVIDTAVRIDWRSCLDVEAGTGKLPLRRALARTVRHQTAAKRGFEVPMGRWLRTSLRGVFEEAVLGRDALAGIEIDRCALRQIFDGHVAGRYDLGWGLWPLLSLALWERCHLAAPAASSGR